MISDRQIAYMDYNTIESVSELLVPEHWRVREKRMSDLDFGVDKILPYCLVRKDLKTQ